MGALNVLLPFSAKISTLLVCTLQGTYFQVSASMRPLPPMAAKPPGLMSRCSADWQSGSTAEFGHSSMTWNTWVPVGPVTCKHAPQSDERLYLVKFIASQYGGSG